MSLRSRLVTIAVVSIYLAVMVLTNGTFTILDDESTIIVFAGHPVLPTLELFLSGSGQHAHPPVSDILLHLWLLTTNFSLFTLRVFANIFFIAGIFFVALSAKRIAGAKAYWASLVLGFVWPFGFQYGRITGWYCFSMFLMALLTWIYLQIIEERGYWSWAGFAITSILLLWTNYFGVVILLLLFFDFMIFHRKLAIRSVRPLLILTAAITLSFVPLLKFVLKKEAAGQAAGNAYLGLKGAMATAGYAIFSIFGSVAVAPWFLPLSIPIVVAAIALFVAIWLSPGRRWLVYFILTMMLLQLTGWMHIKRVLSLLPWLFLAMGVAMSSGASRYRKLASGAIARHGNRRLDWDRVGEALCYDQFI